VEQGADHEQGADLCSLCGLFGCRCRRGGGPECQGEAAVGQVRPPSVWSNLLVRVDSMLLSGAVTVDEARSLRRLVAARDIRAAEAFEDLAEWSDEELSKLLLNFTKGGDRWGQGKF